MLFPVTVSSVSNMDKKVDIVPQVEQAAPPARPRRRGVWVAVGVVLAALILGGAVLGAVAIHNSVKSQHHEQTYDTGMVYSQRIVNQHVRIDDERKIIYVKEERVGSLGGLSYLHDFDKRLTAVRDEVNRKCYLTSAQGTFEAMADGYRRLNGTRNAVQARSYQFMAQPVDRETLRTSAGEEIAEHCRDVPTHWIYAEATAGEECSSAPATNTTVAFRCGEGGVFDPVTMTCMISGGRGQRFKRASLQMQLAGDCCKCCCCCTCPPS